MNPFRPNHPIPVTEQDLVALHMNELTPARANAVRRELEQDPVLAAESASIQAMLAAVSSHSSAEDGGLMRVDQATLDRNWQAVRPQLRFVTPVPSRWQFPALGGGVLAATAAGLALVVYTHHLATPDFGQPRETNQIASTSQDQVPAMPHRPILTATPTGEVESHAAEDGSHLTYRSGVYHPQSHDRNAPIHPIGLAPRREADGNATGAEALNHLAVTRLPAPLLTPEPQTPAITAILTNPVNAAQEQPGGGKSGKGGAHGSGRNPHSLDVMLGVGGTFVAGRGSQMGSVEASRVSATHAIVAIGSVHQQFRRALGYRVTLSYSRPEFDYTSSGLNSSGNGQVNSRIFEATGTYVIQGPHHGRLTTSVDAGGALLAFLPDTSPIPSANASYRGAGVVGVNIDYAITKHVGARLGYRAKIFQGPSFGYTGGANFITTPVIVDNEPSLGVTYTFGKR